MHRILVLSIFILFIIQMSFGREGFFETSELAVNIATNDRIEKKRRFFPLPSRLLNRLLDAVTFPLAEGHVHKRERCYPITMFYYSLTA